MLLETAICTVGLNKDMLFKHVRLRGCFVSPERKLGPKMKRLSVTIVISILETRCLRLSAGPKIGG